jgi:diguanylate cyclase (GGDEF)-like protein/PAS domain S-box-containing protein
MSARSLTRLVAVNLLLVASYVLLAKVGRFLALPLSYATLVWPPAGIAFASCVFFGGRRVWPGLLLGAFVAEATYTGSFEFGWPALVIGAGSTLQALVGELALRRVDAHMELDRARTIGSFIAATAAVCLIAAGIGNAVLAWTHAITAEELPRSFLTWWLGDSLGVLIFLPLFMALVDPRPLWTRRRVQVGIPLLAAMLLTSLAYQVARDNEYLRLTQDFSAQADSLLSELSKFDESNSKALKVMAALSAMPEGLRPDRFSGMAAELRRAYPTLQSLNWVPVMRREDQAPFEFQMTHELGHAYHVAPLPGHTFSDSGLIAPVAIIEPLAGNEPALGRDMLSESVRATAIVKALQSGQLTASGAIKLVQDPSGPGGILINVPVVASDGSNSGVVIGVANLRDLLKPLILAKDIFWRLRDESAAAVVNENIADPPDFKEANYLDRRGVYVQRALIIADRNLKILLFKPYTAFPTPLISSSALLLTITLLTCAGLGMFTLVVSANAERTAREVEHRTKQLRGEIQRRDLSEIALRKSEQEYRQLVETAQEGIWVVGEDNVTTLVNRRMADLLGWDAEALIGTPMDIHMDEQTREIVAADIAVRREGSAPERELALRRKDGSTVWALFSTSPLYDIQGRYTGALAMAVDISDRKQAEEKIKELAFFDQLTGLPNRTLLLDRLKQGVVASARSGQFGALLFIDLDNFKTLNDTLGHHTGDLLLQQVAQRITRCVRAGDTVARFGGDEFVVVLVGVDPNKETAATKVEGIAEKILLALNQNYLLGTAVQRSSASIGVALFSGDVVSVEDLMKQADLAMYKSKEAGRNLVHFFDPALELAVRERAALDEDLRHAVTEKQFLLHYQAQVLGGNQLTGAEVLLRWVHPRRGLVSPAEFIPLAEETGLILPLGQWVLQTACAQLAAWATDARLAHLTISVNVSPHQFRQDIVGTVLDALASTGANPARLKIELTEGLLVENLEDTVVKMFALKAKGVGFSLDDFGTGYSSLAYLKRLPLEQLKIDQSFVRDVLVDPNDAAIARTIIALAHSLGIGVIAEGVETAEQRDFLAASGCHYCQGYYFGRPVPVAQFEAVACRTPYRIAAAEMS